MDDYPRQTILEYVRDHPGSDAVEVARDCVGPYLAPEGEPCVLTAAEAYRILDGLVADGLVERGEAIVPDPDESRIPPDPLPRRAWLRLTAEGLARLAAPE